MGETNEAVPDEAEAAADRLEAALARIATGLSKPRLELDAAPASGPDTAILTARLDGLINRVRDELAATAGKTD